MSVSPDFVAALERAAIDAQLEENRFRNAIADEIAARERARAYAFRRVGLMKRMVGAARGAESAEAARAAQCAALRAELGWHGKSEARDRALDAWGAVADAVTRALACGPDSPEDLAAKTGRAGAEGPSPAEAMATFEAWYREAFGRDFLALMDQEPLDVPVVEF